MQNDQFFLSLFILSIFGVIFSFIQHRGSDGFKRSVLLIFLTCFASIAIYVVGFWMDLFQPIAERRVLLMFMSLIVLILGVQTVNSYIYFLKKKEKKQNDDYRSELDRQYGIK